MKITFEISHIMDQKCKAMEFFRSAMWKTQAMIHWEKSIAQNK